MKSNYNDIIDIILTFIKDEEIAKNILVSGSIVPYLISSKVSHEYHSDLYFLVAEESINDVRKKTKDLSKEYLFDIISDSKKYVKEDYGFKIKYEDTNVGFFPFRFKENIFTIKTYSIKAEEKKIYLKEKNIYDVTKNLIIRQIPFSTDNILKLTSPEYVFLDKKMRERKPHNPTFETMELLNRICDESVLKVLEESMSKMEVKVKYNNLVKKLF